MELKEGQRHKILGNLIIWPIGGCVGIEDERDGSMNFCNLREWVARTKAIHKDATRFLLLPEYYRTMHNDKYTELTRAVCSMHDVWKDAKNQGDPFDPEVIKQMRRERKKAVLVMP